MHLLLVVVVVVVVVAAKSLGIYHGFSPFMSLVSKFGMLVTVRALAEVHRLASLNFSRTSKIAVLFVLFCFLSLSSRYVYSECCAVFRFVSRSYRLFGI